MHHNAQDSGRAALRATGNGQRATGSAAVDGSKVQAGAASVGGGSQRPLDETSCVVGWPGLGRGGGCCAAAEDKQSSLPEPRSPHACLSKARVTCSRRLFTPGALAATAAIGAWIGLRDNMTRS